MIRLIILSLTLLFNNQPIQNNLEFYREDIKFEIQKDIFIVDGTYYFCNTGSNYIKENLFYPFPLNDSLYGGIDSIIVIDLKTNQKIPFIRNKEKGIYFKINLDPYGIIKYKIGYRQKLLGNTAEYILTTTQSWKKSFEIVNYELITPPNIEILSVSYEPDSIFQAENKFTYLWKRKDFMPDKNMLIRFRSK
ncbi:MAG: hypothetical protein ABIJ97_11905, partial [Bacteroidota bacterium]